MKLLMLLTVLALAEAGVDDDTADVIKKRMKLIGGIQNYGKSNGTPKMEQASDSDDIKYLEPELNNSYSADTKFNPLGMGHLYNVTRVFLDLLEGDNRYPDDMFLYVNSTVDEIQKKAPELVKIYPEVVAVVGVGVVFIVLMPIVGLVFCCCRCSGRCGARKKQEKQRDPCKRVMIATALGGVAVIILFGVVSAFVTNQHMTDGIDKLVPNLKSALGDVVIYLSNTNKEIDYLLVKNYEQLKNKLNSSVGNAGNVVKNQLASTSRAVALANLTTIVAGMEIVKQDLAGIRETTIRLQSATSSLNDDLDILRQELINQLRSCINEAACRHLLQQHQITELRVAQNFSQLPDITETFAMISSLLGDNNSIDSIQRKVLDGQKNFDRIKYQITRAVEESMPVTENQVEKIGKSLRKFKDDFVNILGQVQNSINSLTGKYLDQADDKIIDYSPYRYYIGLGVSVALLLVLVCLTFGLLCGICGKRPEEMYSEDSDCCNTATGGKFLMLAVWLSFLLSSSLMIVTMVHFLLGLSFDLVICKPLNDPSENKVFKLVDRLNDLSSIYGKKDVNIKLSEILVACHKNQSIYETFQLTNLYNIDDLRKDIQKSYVEEQIRKLKSRINIRTDDVVLLDPGAKMKLISLARSPLNDIQFDKYAELLNLQVTKINLTQLSNELLMNSEKLPTYSSGGYDLSNIKKFLRTKARYLKILQSSIVADIESEINILRSNVSNLKEHLKFNHTSLHDAIINLLNEIENAQLYLQKNGSAEMKALIDQYLYDTSQYVDNYVDRVITKIKKDIGKCGPMSNAYDSAKVALCNRILDPFNGFWSSVACSVLLFIPAIILSVKLAALYTKSEAYGPPGMYAENEYLYDAYADRDNMPLAMAQRVGKKKSRHRNYQESFDNSGTGSYLQDYGAHHGRTARASTDTDVRYNDMAPKHWNDVSSRGSGSGPPRYHHPSSTEYERPPPYYFPGPGERS